MPTDLAESVTGDVELVFPDNAPGKQYRLRESAVYDAVEVRDEIGAGDDDVPQFGHWLPVTILDRDETGFLNAPSELRQELVSAEAEAGDEFRVEFLEQRGNGPSDPYSASIEMVTDTDQASLTDS